MKIYIIDFDPKWPVPSGLVVLAESEEQALEIAKETVKHTDVRGIVEVYEVDKPGVIFYEDGDY
jgi:predicted O-methyltransferase YrrM